MSATRPDLHVVRDPGPGAEWLKLIERTSVALNEPPDFRTHVLAAFVIVGLSGAIVGSLLTIVLLRTVGAL